MQSKIYLISGAGSGIGRAIAQKLAATQYNCILLERKESGLKETRCDNEQLILLLSL